SWTPNGLAIESALSGVPRLHTKVLQQIKSEILDKYYSHLRIGSTDEAPSKDSLTITKHWVQDQLPKLIVDDFDVWKNDINSDGSKTIAGVAKTKSTVAPDIGMPSTYEFQATLTASNVVLDDPKKSFVKKR